MSKIKEELIGYEDNDWISNDDHVKVDEVTEYLLYAMSVAEMQQAADSTYSTTCTLWRVATSRRYITTL